MDIVNINIQSKILDIVSKSYYNIIKKSPDSWSQVWQNECAVDLTDYDRCTMLIRDSILVDKISIPVKKDKKI